MHASFPTPLLSTTLPPARRVRDALPPTFEEALQAAISSRAAATGGGGGGAASRYRRVQAALVLGQVQDLVCRSLVGWITQARRAAVLRGAGGWGAGGEGCAADGRKVCLALFRVHKSRAQACVPHPPDHGLLPGPPSPQQGTGDGAGADGAPACPPGLMRFAAHLALALWALDIAVTEGDG